MPTKAYRDINFLTGPQARSLRILAKHMEPASRFAKEGVANTVVFFGSDLARHRTFRKRAVRRLFRRRTRHNGGS